MPAAAPVEEPFLIQHTDDPDKDLSDLQEDADDRLADIDVAQQQEIKALQVQVDALTAKLDSFMDSKILASAITDDPPQRADVGTGDDTSDPHLDELEETQQKAEAEAGKATDKEKEWTVSKFLVLATGLVATGATVWALLKYLMAKAAAPTTDPPPLPKVEPGTQALLDKLYAGWSQMTESEFWTSLADYVDKHPDELPLGAQLVFMQITISTAPDSGGFIWDTSADQAKAADTLVSAYVAGGKTTSAIYRAVPALTYQQAPLPRVVGAQTAKLALAWVGLGAQKAAS